MKPAFPSVRILACAFLFLATAARADTIVLKNGRRISASNVVEENGRVSYETSAGRLSLPMSVVDHVEKGSVPAGGPGESASQLAIPAPASQISADSEEILGRVVQDGQINREYVAKLDQHAHAGQAEDTERAAVAHHVLALFELRQGDVEQALNEERTAVNLAPQQPVLLMELAYLHLRRNECHEALEYLDRARRVAPDSPEVPKLAGWAWYGMGKLDKAVSEWKHALALREDAEVEAALEKAQRDLITEESFKERESKDFTLRYEGGAEPDLAREVLHTLENHFSAIESELNYTPREPIGVILYTQETFADITRAPNWVGALNDGRMRIPVQGLTSVTPELSRILKHELTHSFLTQKTLGRCPVWLQEGLAQWMEGKRSGEYAADLLQAYDAKQAVPLGTLEGSWMRLQGDAAAYAYAWSLANVEYIIQTNGMGDMTRVLDHIATGESTEAALETVLRSNYNDLGQATAEYLRRSYAH
jgi:tetratricopeptide (TPR) repeat protein